MQNVIKQYEVKWSLQWLIESTIWFSSFIEQDSSDSIIDRNKTASEAKGNSYRAFTNLLIIYTQNSLRTTPRGGGFWSTALRTEQCDRLVLHWSRPIGHQPEKLTDNNYRKTDELDNY